MLFSWKCRFSVRRVQPPRDGSHGLGMGGIFRHSLLAAGAWCETKSPSPIPVGRGDMVLHPLLLFVQSECEE